MNIQSGLGLPQPTYTCSGERTVIACTECRLRFDLPVTQHQIDAWKAGALIQRAMPNLSAAERELFISGYCNSCFEAIFADDSEEEES